MDDEGPSPKKGRREVKKRVVTVPVTGEAAPSTDTWAWRKYGQKPIIGSPYPRNYYRCSSWKGCTARKQVERSRVDPTLLVVTYSSGHNHSWPLSSDRNYRAEPPLKPKVSVSGSDSDPAPMDADSEPKEVDPKGGWFVDLIGGDQGEFRWLSNDGSPSTSASPTEGLDDTLLYGSIAGCGVAMLWTEEMERDGEEDEDSLFAGLGELPECSAVFRRRIMAAAETKS
ncbi:WRKY domain-containing protein [Dioscorea alata]|uniref:WRKY domain-containing protein n=1 Tax=Dioscorea alata TaxID=55571 RepID=A0ACB7WDZ6_DIOAL|nr:WRKY domain-containing protein [Dioscorea alata]